MATTIVVVADETTNDSDLNRSLLAPHKHFFLSGLRFSSWVLWGGPITHVGDFCRTNSAVLKVRCILNLFKGVATPRC